ncbi:hypothetical protein GCM10010254_48850 [Streptomyces chromofuscus]|nr:hypothetical protein GCM10010254_48850 [Streptomyces chromofuscus]
MFLLRRSGETGERALLDAAGAALRRDLDCCVVQKGGSLEVDEGRRTMPYLGDGSVGLGMVLDDYLAHAGDEAGTATSARATLLTACAGPLGGHGNPASGVRGRATRPRPTARFDSRGMGRGGRGTRCLCPAAARPRRWDGSPCEADRPATD